MKLLSQRWIPLAESPSGEFHTAGGDDEIRQISIVLDIGVLLGHELVTGDVPLFNALGDEPYLSGKEYENG